MTGAHPAGTYPVTVIAYDSGGTQLGPSTAFTLTVLTPATCTFVEGFDNPEHTSLLTGILPVLTP